MKWLATLLAAIALAPLAHASTVESCEPPLPPCESDCLPCSGAVTELELFYKGAERVLVIAYQNDIAVYCEEVPPCTTFHIFDGHWVVHPVGADLQIYINDQYATTVPMNCDPGVRPGDTFGDFVVVSGRSEAGPLCTPCDTPPPPPPPGPCGCDGKVTELVLQYLGAASAQVRVEQKKDQIVVFDTTVDALGAFLVVGADKLGTLGTEIRIFVDGALNAAIHTSCSQPIGPGLRVGDFLVLEGRSRNGGALCPLDDPNDPPPSNEPCACEGKVTKLSLRYVGVAPALVEVKQRDGVRVFGDLVAPGGILQVQGTDRHGTLGTEISLLVDGVLNVKIHTSCSQPIGPGLLAGLFEVVAGESRTGGALCPVTSDQEDGGDDDDQDGKKKGKKGLGGVGKPGKK